MVSSHFHLSLHEVYNTSTHAVKAISIPHSHSDVQYIYVALFENSIKSFYLFTLATNVENALQMVCFALACKAACDSRAKASYVDTVNYFDPRRTIYVFRPVSQRQMKNAEMVSF